jgi:hypothetical protein
MCWLWCHSGVDASPLMTWGEIEGTPFRLDGSDTPLIGSTRGPMFKIPEVPRRDRLLHELAEKTSKAHRDKKEKALKQVTASFSRFATFFCGINLVRWSDEQTLSTWIARNNC